MQISFSVLWQNICLISCTYFFCLKNVSYLLFYFLTINFVQDIPFLYDNFLQYYSFVRVCCIFFIIFLYHVSFIFLCFIFFKKILFYHEYIFVRKILFFYVLFQIFCFFLFYISYSFFINEIYNQTKKMFILNIMYEPNYISFLKYWITFGIICFFISLVLFFYIFLYFKKITFKQLKNWYYSSICCLISLIFYQNIITNFTFSMHYSIIFFYYISLLLSGLISGLILHLYYIYFFNFK